MATVVNEHRRERRNIKNQVSYRSTFAVVFDRDGDASGWTALAAETAVKGEGYTYGSTLGGVGDCPPLRNYRTTQREEAAHVYEVVCEFATEDPDDPEARDANDEWVEYQGGTTQQVVHYDTTNHPLQDANHNPCSAPVQMPTKIIRVHRIHTASKNGSWESYACKTNSGTVTTPGGVELCTTAKKLLFMYATERKLQNGNYEVIYVFEEDLARIAVGAGAVVEVLHQACIATISPQTGLATAVTPYEVYEQAAIGSAMADE